MNQAELIAKLADTAGLDKAQAGQAVEGVLATISDALKAGEKVSLQGLGIFEISDRAARQGRNPATGESIQIPASKAVKFRPTRGLKEAISPPAPKAAKPVAKKAPAKKPASKT